MNVAGQYAHSTAFELQMWQTGFLKNSSEAMAVRALGAQGVPR